MVAFAIANGTGDMNRPFHPALIASVKFQRKKKKYLCALARCIPLATHRICRNTGNVGKFSIYQLVERLTQRRRRYRTRGIIPRTVAFLWIYMFDRGKRVRGVWWFDALRRNHSSHSIDFRVDLYFRCYFRRSIFHAANTSVLFQRKLRIRSIISEIIHEILQPFNAN